MMRSAKKTYEIDMLHGAILPKLLRFAVPLTLSTMLQLLFNAADVVVVGRWAGDNSLAAVGSNTSLIALLTNMFLGLSIGANILAARYFGAHEDEGTPAKRSTPLFCSPVQRRVPDSGRYSGCPDHSDLDAVSRQCAGSGHALPADLLRRHDRHHAL